MSARPYVLRRAEPDEISVVQDLLRQTARWLRDRGYDQWDNEARRFSSERLRPAVEHGDVWLLWDRDVPVATITLSFEGDPEFWTPEELAERSAYVAKLAVKRSVAGQELGARLLAWARNYAARHGAAWVRLDAWKTNPELHAYYRKRGWQYVRTVDLPHRKSGALFQLPAGPADHDGIVERHADPKRLGVLQTQLITPGDYTGLTGTDNAGNWRPPHQHVSNGGAPWVFSRELARPVPVSWLPGYQYRIAADEDGAWVLSVREGGRWHPAGRILTEPGEHGDLMCDRAHTVPAEGPSLVESDSVTRWTLERGREYIVDHEYEQPGACRVVVYEVARPWSTEDASC